MGTGHGDCGHGGRHGPPPGMFLLPLVIMGAMAMAKRARCGGGPGGGHHGPPWAAGGGRREWIEQRLEEWHRKAHGEEAEASS